MIEIEEPLAPGETALETMSAIGARVEAWVRDHPDQYLWHHRRWRR
jgi:lauroyl/myristoyl acyltransferase